MSFGVTQDPAQHGRVGALVLHSTHDPRETTAKARATFRSKFEADVDPEGLLEPAERARRAEYARRAHYARMALASARSRSKPKKKRTTEETNPVAAAAIDAEGAGRATDQQLQSE